MAQENFNFNMNISNDNNDDVIERIRLLMVGVQEIAQGVSIALDGKFQYKSENTAYDLEVWCSLAIGESGVKVQQC